MRLKSEVREHLAIIVAEPDRLRPWPRGYRRINLRIFPYYIAYFLDGEILWIVAIAHAHRRPEFWRKRRQTASDSDAGGIFNSWGIRPPESHPSNNVCADTFEERRVPRIGP